MDLLGLPLVLIQSVLQYLETKQTLTLRLNHQWHRIVVMKDKEECLRVANAGITSISDSCTTEAEFVRWTEWRRSYIRWHVRYKAQPNWECMCIARYKGQYFCLGRSLVVFPYVNHMKFQLRGTTFMSDDRQMEQ